MANPWAEPLTSPYCRGFCWVTHTVDCEERREDAEFWDNYREEESKPNFVQRAFALLKKVPREEHDRALDELRETSW